MSTQHLPNGAAPGASAAIAQINGVPLQRADETLTREELRQRACTELLRQAALAEGLLDSGDASGADGIISEAASSAIEQLLERKLEVPEPAEEACRRHYAAHAQSYRTGEQAQVRHILFALTPGMDVAALRRRAEACLLDVRCHDGGAQDRFASVAREFSNCPSGAQGGNLGWLVSGDCAPEFARELFGQPQVGVLPRLVHSRFGLHVVEVLARRSGIEQPFDAVRGAVRASLRQQSFVTGLRQYLRLLAGQASVCGVELEAAATPLVQ